MSNLACHELGHPRKFEVTITEMLKRTVDATEDDPHEARQMVPYGWHSSKYILGFNDVEFDAVPVADSSSTNDRYWN